MNRINLCQTETVLPLYFQFIKRYLLWKASEIAFSRSLSIFSVT